MLAAFFLESGAEPLTDYPFAHAFHQLGENDIRFVPGLSPQST